MIKRASLLAGCVVVFPDRVLAGTAAAAIGAAGVSAGNGALHLVERGLQCRHRGLLTSSRGCDRRAPALRDQQILAFADGEFAFSPFHSAMFVTGTL